MSNNSSGLGCALGSWALAAGAGLLAMILMLVIGQTTIMAALFLGLLAVILLGLLFSWIFCRPLPAPGTVTPGEKRGLRAEPHSADHAPVAASAAPAASSGPAQASAAAAPEAPAAAPSAAAPAAAAPAAASGPMVKPSKALSGQDDLASRKGSWKYEGAASGAGATGASAADATPEAASAAVEGPGKKPEALAAPRDGGADDLKRIKGIGPKLEKLCHSLGFFHFDQIAGWTAQEVAWVDQNLEGFKGRVTRDLWVEQARLLASGEETEFSKKVNKGDVY